MILAAYQKVFNIWKYSLILPYFALNKDKNAYRYRRSYIRLSLMLIIVSIYIFVIVVGHNYEAFSVDSFVLKLYFSIICTHSSLSLYFFHRSNEDIEQIIEKLGNIYQVLEDGKIRMFLSKNGMYWYTFLMYNFFSMILLDGYLASSKLYWQWPDVIIIYISSFIDIHYQQFYFTTKFILLSMYKNKSFIHENYESIDNFNNIRKKLNEVHLQFSETFSIVVLVRFWYNFGCLLISIFLILILEQEESDMSMRIVELIVSTDWMLVQMLTMRFFIFVDVDARKKVIEIDRKLFMIFIGFLNL